MADELVLKIFVLEEPINISEQVVDLRYLETKLNRHFDRYLVD